jgi:nicotinamidase-related amidase
MKDVLVVIDVLNDFEHDEGERLLASFRGRASGLRDALERARAGRIPVVYVNDQHGSWRSDRGELVRLGIEGRGGDEVRLVAPLDDEPLLLKTRYSGFDHTGLALLLGELGAERLLLAGGSTEGCIVQTGIDARELGFKVTILTSACSTADAGREEVALRYAEEVAGIFLAAENAAVLTSSRAREPDRTTCNR